MEVAQEGMEVQEEAAFITSLDSYTNEMVKL